jgi:hypothetical protein
MSCIDTAFASILASDGLPDREKNWKKIEDGGIVPVCRRGRLRFILDRPFLFPVTE